MRASKAAVYEAVESIAGLTTVLKEQLDSANLRLRHLEEVSNSVKKANRTLAMDAMVQMHRRLIVEGRCRQEAVAKWPAGNDEVDRDFCCAICLDVLILPVTHRCGHTMCAPCNTRILTSASSVHVCPLCRAPIDDTEPSVQLRDIVERRYPLHVAHRLSTYLAERQPADEALQLTCTATSTGA